MISTIVDDSDFNQRVAARVRELRDQRGLSIESLAHRSGVSRAMISRIERAESSPTAVVLNKLSIGLGVLLPTLFGAASSSYRRHARTSGTKRAWKVRRLTKLDAKTLHGLCDVLQDCVEGGASVNFMQPLTRKRAENFWQKIALDVKAGRRDLLIAEDANGICGTVQLCFDMPENQPHRADVAKMLVHRRARRSGLGAALLLAAESAARARDKTLLVLDTVTKSDGARLYERMGWQRVGDIPGYALWPHGGPCSTTYYYRTLY
jgi:GNAT superfamily N-acetyltransferase/DNA-binding XRE family transcriptional regulator